MNVFEGMNKVKLINFLHFVCVSINIDEYFIGDTASTHSHMNVNIAELFYFQALV